MKPAQKYAVYILQATGESLEIIESSFEICKEMFDKLELELEKARKTKGALFKLRDPWILSCDPSVIVRLTLTPKKTPSLVSADNPYQKRMENLGFSKALRNPSENTDEGYTTD